MGLGLGLGLVRGRGRKPAAPSSVVLKLSARLTSSDRTYPVPSMERSIYCAVPAPNLPSTMTRSFSMRLAVEPA